MNTDHSGNGVRHNYFIKSQSNFLYQICLTLRILVIVDLVCVCVCVCVCLCVCVCVCVLCCCCCFLGVCFVVVVFVLCPELQMSFEKNIFRKAKKKFFSSRNQKHMFYTSYRHDITLMFLLYRYACARLLIIIYSFFCFPFLNNIIVFGFCSIVLPRPLLGGKKKKFV